MKLPFPKLGLSSTQKNILIGGVLSSAVDTVIDHGLARAGALYAVKVLDGKDNYVWGIGTGDVANLAIGAGIALYGSKKRKPKFKEIGFGWILAGVTTKIAELGGYVQTLDPVWPVTYTVGGSSLRTARSATPAMFGQYSAPSGQSKYRITS